MANQPASTRVVVIKSNVPSRRLPPQRDGAVGLCVPDFAQALGLGEGSVWKMIREGSLLVVRIGRRTIIPRSELDRILASAN